MSLSRLFSKSQKFIHRSKIYTCVYCNYNEYLRRWKNIETVKARLQGNSTILTIPRAFDVKKGTVFEVTYQSDGSILYQPQKNYDIWADKELDGFDYEKELQEEYRDLGYNPREVKPVGKGLPHDWYSFWNCHNIRYTHIDPLMNEQIIVYGGVF